MSHHPSASAANSRPAVTLHRLREQARSGERLTMLTCYDATFARLLDAAGVDMLLVGDSLGNVVQGHRSTVPVTLEQMAYHTACVARAQPTAWLVGDMPFGAYEASPERAFAAAATLMQAGAQMVKLEGAGVQVATVRALTERGIPVCGHLGLTPQRVHALGGFRVQGRGDAAADLLLADATALAEAGAAMLVLELMPSAVARRITEALPDLITIGIGAGSATRGQVLVLHDMLGLGSGRLPKFVRDFSRAPDGSAVGVPQALAQFVADVRSGAYPDESLHAYD